MEIVVYSSQKNDTGKAVVIFLDSEQCVELSLEGAMLKLTHSFSKILTNGFLVGKFDGLIHKA